MRKSVSVKIGCSILCMLLLLLPGMAACASLNPAPDEEALKADARQVVEDMLAGDYEKVVERFNDAMMSAMSAGGQAVDALQVGWEKAVMFLGEYAGNVSVRESSEQGYFILDMTEEFENNGLLIHLVYDGEGKIAGMYMTVAELEKKEDKIELAENEFFSEEEVTVQAVPETPLGGTLTLPKNVEKPPVVILVQGSGVSNRDEALGENKPFADLAYGLAKRGIAVLRYDKRHYIYQDFPDVGSSMNVTLREETLDDVRAAVELLEADERTGNIYVLGHSLGGCLTPAIAAENPGLSGVISMAGSLRPLWEISYDQNQEVIQTAREAELIDSAQLDEQVQKLEADIDLLRNHLNEQKDEDMILGIPARYWKSIQEYCGINYIDRVQVPMLILQGSADFQVYPEKDFVLWQETLAGRDNVIFHLYENLNHLMMPTQGKRDISEYAAENHVDEQVIEDIAAFIEDTEK